MGRRLKITLGIAGGLAAVFVSALGILYVRPGSASERDGFAWAHLVAEADSVEARSARVSAYPTRS